MNLSFKDYATQFAGFKLPVSALAVAKPLVPPVSLRKIMSAGAPYPPDLGIFGFFDNSNNPSQVAFFWADEANLPPFDNLSTPVDPRRMATSWTFELWETLGDKPDGQIGANIIDANVSLHAHLASGQIEYDYNSGLVGNYIFQVTAFNNYGSSSTGNNPVTITLPASAPVLTVTRSGNTNSFRVSGTGFLPGSSVTIEVDLPAFGTALSSLPGAIGVGSDGSFSSTPVSCQPLCAANQGAQLRFVAVVNGTAVTWNTSNSCAT
jgi:hypothetical protein